MSFREPTELERLQSDFSDLYKDVYGFRPRSVQDECWNDEEFLKSEIAYLSKKIVEVLNQEAEEELKAENQFYEKLDSLIACGADDRKVAFRWFIGSMGYTLENLDAGYVEFELGTGYGFIRKFMTENGVTL